MAWKKGKPLSEETRQKMSETHKKIGSKPPSWQGKKHTEETKRRMSAAQIRVKPTSLGQVSDVVRKQALIRDDYTCQVCGLREPEIMQVDHIKPKRIFPRFANDIENLLTLCPNCHARKTNRDRTTFGWHTKPRKKK